MPEPPAEEVHVWLVPAARADAVADLLDDGERQRAARFSFDRDRQLYVAAHGALRWLLGRYLDQPPRSLRFEVADNGKPFAAAAADGAPAVEFNLSHSGALAVVAVAHDRPVGVDVERERPLRSEDGVARRVMATDELARYHALEGDARRRFLLWAWARKEALVKASGEGVRRLLTQVPCEPGPDDRWAVVDLPIPGYAAAVAAEGHDWSPVVRELGAAS
ncbi:MAG TPA: 4'-phosphopantetheinyl transferase superfamily protein [Acidimicrobiales bacterium]|jgi:4'-phosphopantetheinyl transferase